MHWSSVLCTLREVKIKVQIKPARHLMSLHRTGHEMPGRTEVTWKSYREGGGPSVSGPLNNIRGQISFCLEMGFPEQFEEMAYSEISTL